MKLTIENYADNANHFPKYGDFWYAVYDDFLPHAEYGQLKSYLDGNGGFPWNFSSGIAGPDTAEGNEAFYFSTMIMGTDAGPQREWRTDIDLHPFMFLTSKMNIVSFLRMKTNMYFKSYSGNIDIHAPHVDYHFNHNGALFFLTECDATTMLEDGTAVESKQNRMMFFNASRAHSSSAPSNTAYRQTINMNYFSDPHSHLIQDNHFYVMPKANPIISHNYDNTSNRNKVRSFP